MDRTNRSIVYFTLGLSACPCPGRSSAISRRPLSSSGDLSCPSQKVRSQHHPCTNTTAFGPVPTSVYGTWIPSTSANGGPPCPPRPLPEAHPPSTPARIASTAHRYFTIA